MSKTVVIIGAVALGPKVACRLQRLSPSTKVILIDEQEMISYGGCGIPYYLSGEISALNDLRSTPYHTIRDATFFRDMKGVEVRTATKVLKIDRQNKKLLLHSLKDNTKTELAYDKLVLATGARPRTLNIKGHDLQNVLTLTQLAAAEQIRTACEKGRITNAVIIGGGFIGLEAAVSLSDMWGVNVSIVEMLPQLLSGLLSPSLSQMALNDCQKHHVNVYLNEKVQSFEANNDGAVSKVITNQRTIDTDLVILATGFIPNTQLAKEAGLELTDFGAIAIKDQFLRTSDPDIYAGGDCASLPNLLTHSQSYLPLGSMANRQGRIIGSNLASECAGKEPKEQFHGFIGSWAVKLFDLAFCGAGLNVERAQKSGFDALGIQVSQFDKAHFYPEKSMLCLELVTDQKTRQILGIQGAGENPDSLKARTDMVAALLQKDKTYLEEICTLEASYAPPFAAAMDIINVVANVTENALEARFKPLSPVEFADRWENRIKNNALFLDVRPANAGKNLSEKYPQWQCISLEDLPSQIANLPKNRPIISICNTGLRSYDAVLLLARHGFQDVVSVSAGMQALKKMGWQP